MSWINELFSRLHWIDWAVIAGSLALIVLIGVAFKRKAGKDLTSFFLGGRNLPWLVAGISMVATTFAADTPLAVTEMIGNNGIAGNWLWWNFLMGGMLTTFFFANLWRKAGVLTDVELVELRYTGKPAAFLRALKSVYFGLFINVLIIGWVNLAMITILEVFFGITYAEAFYILGLLLVLVAIYSAASGLLGVAITDNIQFVLAMTGSIALAVFVVGSEQIGGLEAMSNQVGMMAPQALNFFPGISQQESGSQVATTLSLGLGAFLAHMTIQWWSSWYPGAEPGGGGYIAQRMMSTKNEKHAVYSTLFFQVAHYCIRPWPWIIVALCALVMYGQVSPKVKDPALQKSVFSFEQSGHVPSEAFVMDSTGIEELAAGDDYLQNQKHRLFAVNQQLQEEAQTNPELENTLAYQDDKKKGYVMLMKEHMPIGWKGLLLAAFFAAFMSTISTQVNWGSSYLVNDFYQRFINNGASDKTLIFTSRLITLVVLLLGWLITWIMTSISGVWTFLIECGAGLGLVLILRWYWWRINAWSEITATIAPFIGYSIAQFWIGWTFPHSFFFTVSFTTVAWLTATLLTRPEPRAHLQAFYKRVEPDGWWQPIARQLGKTTDYTNLQNLGICWLAAIVVTYSVLFGVGKIILTDHIMGAAFLSIAVIGAVILRKYLKRTKVFK